MKSVLAILFFFLIPILTHKVFHDVSGNFRLNKVLFSLSKKQSLPLEEEQKTKILNILDQEFTYKAKGHHVYAFISQDGKYILKLFRYHKFKPAFWWKLFSNKWREKKMNMKKERLQFLETSHKIAFQHLKEETQVFYIHLEKTENLKKEIILKNIWGKKVSLDLDTVGFVLQKRFELYQNYFPKFIRQNDIENIRMMLRCYFEIIQARFSKGIINKDRRGWSRNYGIVFPDIAYEIDLGGFRYVEERDSPYSEVFECSRDFREWLEKHAPQYTGIFYEELEKAQKLTPLQHAHNRCEKLQQNNLKIQL